MPRHIHIVCFDIPFPANYGGVIDIYYKAKALKDKGVSVTLHCYQYGRKKNKKELLKVCEKVHYYKRQSLKNPFMGSKPYIVNSRNGEQLLKNLCKDGDPILFEGLHCTYYLNHKALKDRYKIVRAHNIEHHYYKNLEQSELRYFKKYFFRIEAEKLRKYESILKHASLIAAISANDKKHFSKKYNNVAYIPAFHSNTNHSFEKSRGDFVLYHGNLAVAENYIAAIELCHNVFSKLDYPCVIAGNNPPKELSKVVEFYPNVELVTNITNTEIHDLIKDAHINVLYTKQNTGIKLKLLNALYLGKFTIVNPLMVEGTGLDNICVVGQDFDAIISQLNEYMLLDYTANYAKRRYEYLQEHFSNEESVNTLIDKCDFDAKLQPARKSDSKVTSGLSQFSMFLSYFSL